MERDTLVENFAVEENVEAAVVVAYAAQEGIGGLSRPTRITAWIAHDNRREVGVWDGEQVIDLLGGGVHDNVVDVKKV